jgi:voltage-gated sodium channel
VEPVSIAQQAETATAPSYAAPARQGGIVAHCRQVADAPWFQFGIIGVIILNAIVLGLETSPGLQTSFGGVFRWFSHVAQAIFAVEILIRITAHWPRPQQFYRDGWNNFDFIVVAAAFIPATGGLSNLARLARLLRVTRLVSALPELRLIFETLVRSIPSIAHIVALLCVFVYVYAIAGHQLFSAVDPDHWGSLGASLVTLFQVLTLEDWHEVHAAVRETHPWSWAFFLSYIVVAVMVVANLAVAVIINSLEAAKQADARQSLPTNAAPTLQKLAEIRQSLASLEDELRSGPDRR